MSILRHFNKHQGWNDGKRTYNGGGGGLGNFFAEIDPVEAFKGAANSTADEEFRQADWASENGWMLPIALVAGAYAAGEMVGEAAVAGAGGATAADGTFFAAGELVPAGTTLAEGTAIGAGEGALTTGEIASSGGFTPVGGASFGVEPGAAYTTGAVGGGATNIGLGTDAALQGPTYGELGVTGVPEGGMGPTYAEMGNTGLNTEQAIAAADAAARNAQIVEGLKTANQVRQGANTLSKLLKSGSQFGGSQLANATQNLAQGQTKMPMAIPTLLRGNQNPFVMTQNLPIQNKKTDLTSLAELLKQG
jgi:hypothetical protein